MPAGARRAGDNDTNCHLRDDPGHAEDTLVFVPPGGLSTGIAPGDPRACVRELF